MSGPSTPPRAPVRPLGEAPLARRTAIVAFAFFFASAVDLAVEGVTLATLLRAFPLYALGGFCILIFGTSRLLISGMAGRDVAGGAAGSFAVTALAAAGAVALFLAQDRALALRAGAAAIWGLGALGHVAVTTMTVRSKPVRPPVRDERASPSSRPPIRALEAGSLAYALACAFVVPLAYADRVARASAVHLVLLGFVIVTIMGVAAHALPRFTRTRVPTTLLVALVVPALVGPALTAVALDDARHLLFTGAVLEGAAFVLFGALVLTMLARADRFRTANALYAVAPLAIGVGGLVALTFAANGAMADKLAAHAVLNVFGFVGLFVMGASTDLYGPALSPGARPARRHVAVGGVVLFVGLVVAAYGAWSDIAWVARAGMLAYAAAILWQLAGIVASHRRAGRVVSRLRGS